MNWAIKPTSYMASGASIAFAVITALLIFGSNKIGAPFMKVMAERWFPVIGIAHILLQIAPLSIRGFHGRADAHDYVTSWIALACNIATFVAAGLLMQLNGWAVTIGIHGIGFQLLDVALLAAAYAGQRLVAAVPAPVPPAHP